MIAPTIIPIKSRLLRGLVGAMTVGPLIFFALSAKGAPAALTLAVISSCLIFLLQYFSNREIEKNEEENSLPLSTE